MPSTQADFVGEGAGDVRPEVELGVPPGVVGGGLDGVPPGDVPLGVVDGVPPDVGLPDELPPGLFVDDFLPGFVLPGVPEAPAPPGAVTPLAGWVPRDEPDDEVGDGMRLSAGLLLAGDPTGSRFAAGAPLNAPETSSATRPTPATAAAPTAIVPFFRRREGPG